MKKSPYLHAITCVFALALLLSSCDVPLASPTSTRPFTSTPESIADKEPAQTHVVIDGKGSDWTEYEVVGSDPANDQVSGSPDLAEVRAFINDKFFYAMVVFYEKGVFDHIIFAIEMKDGSTYQLNAWPGKSNGEISRPIGSNLIPITVESAQNEVVEVKISLVDIGSLPLRIQTVSTYLGKGHGRGDIMDGGPQIKLIEQIEPQVVYQVERTERPSHVFLADGTQAEYLYRSFIQLPTGLAMGPDGYLYIADWTGRHVVRRTPDGTLDDLGIWRNPGIWQDDGPRGLAFDSNGALYVSDHSNIYRIEADGHAEPLQGIAGASSGDLVIGPSDRLYYTDRGEGVVYRWNPLEGSEVVASDLPSAEIMVFGLDGTLYVSQMGRGVVQIDVETGEVSEFFSGPLGPDQIYLAVDADGDIWMRGLCVLYQIDPDGKEKPYLIDGQSFSGDGPFSWHSSSGIAFDNEGGLLIASYNSRIIRLDPPTQGQETNGMSISVVEPGFESRDLDIGPNGEIYATNMNTGELWRISPEGEVEVLLQYGVPSDGAHAEAAVAVDDEGTILLGLPNGEISQVETDGSLSHYAWLMTQNMVFGEDGALYAAVGNYDEPKSLVRITGVDTYATLLDEIEGVALGCDERPIAAAPGGGIFVTDGSYRKLYHIDSDGHSRLVVDLEAIAGGSVWMMAASPSGEIFFIGPRNTLYRLDPEGNAEIYARNLFGDPWAMVASLDGQWLYVAESGAIDKIPLHVSD